MVTSSGSLVQLCCGEEGTLQTNITGACWECLQCLGNIGFTPAHGVCAFPVYTAQVPGCSAGKLSRAGPGLRALPRSEPLGFRFSGTSQRHRLSWACVLCPSQVRAAQATRCLVGTHFPGAVRLITSPVPVLSFLCTVGAPSQVCHVSLLGSLSLAATLPVDVNRTGSQEDLVNNWEPAHSLVEDAISGAKIALFRLWLPPACLPVLNLSPQVLAQSFVL